MMAKAEEKVDQVPGKEEAPSMEDILQSIRGVISGDEAEDGDVLELTEMVEEVAQDAAAPLTVAEESVAQEKSILDDIDDALDAPKVEAAPEVPAEPEVVAVAAAVVEEVIPEVSVAEEVVETPAPEVIMEEQPVLNDSQTSSEADMNTQVPDDDALEADSSAFPTNINSEVNGNIGGNGRLLDEEVVKESADSLKVLVNSVHEKHVVSPNTRGGVSLEDLVIEAIKPFLADWLNKNLPVLVKKIVEKEVKRLIPKEEDDY